MAEVMRQHVLAERVARAHTNEERLEQARRKRLERAEMEAARVQQKMQAGRPSEEERVRRLRDLAETTREIRQASIHMKKEVVE